MAAYRRRHRRARGRGRTRHLERRAAKADVCASWRRQRAGSSDGAGRLDTYITVLGSYVHHYGPSRAAGTEATSSRYVGAPAVFVRRPGAGGDNEVSGALCVCGQYGPARGGVSAHLSFTRSSRILRARGRPLRSAQTASAVRTGSASLAGPGGPRQRRLDLADDAIRRAAPRSSRVDLVPRAQLQREPMRGVHRGVCAKWRRGRRRARAAPRILVDVAGRPPMKSRESRGFRPPRIAARLGVWTRPGAG